MGVIGILLLQDTMSIRDGRDRRGVKSEKDWAQDGPLGHTRSHVRRGSTNAQQMHRKCTSNAPQMHRKCTANAPQMHRKCTANAPQMHRKCTANAPRMHRICAANAPQMHRKCIANAPQMHHTAHIVLEKGNCGFV